MTTTEKTSQLKTGFSTWLDVHIWQWQAASFLVALVVAAPILVILLAWLQPSSEVWQHLAQTVLARIVGNTLLLMLGVGLGVFALGVSLAALTAMCDFPGRRFFDWAFMLPLAIPAYVLAFVYIGLLDFSGPVQSGLRTLFATDSLWFPAVRSTGGVLLVMTLAFYPYVYMLARAAFISQGRSMFETGRIHGLSPVRAFVKVTLPMARPAIAAGVALALMETLADFGTVSIFNYSTFTTAIYKAWFGLFSLPAAAQLASLLLLFVAVALVLEKHLRGKARFHTSQKGQYEQRYRLYGWQKWSAVAFAGIVVLLAFVIPMGQLLMWLWEGALGDLDLRYLGFFSNTLFLGFLAAAVTAMVAVTLAYTSRLRPDRLIRVAVRFATLGYALPGSVLAVGIMLSFVWIDREILGPIFTDTGKTVLTGTLLALLLAYVVRFLAVAYGPIDSAFETIKPTILQAARCRANRAGTDCRQYVVIDVGGRFGCVCSRRQPGRPHCHV